MNNENMHRQMAQIPRHRFTRDDYHRMAEVGILSADARVELLDGEIVEKSPIGPRHNAIVDRLNDHFARTGARKCICRVQGSIALVGESEPEPDIVLLKYRDDFYATDLPMPDDVLLIVEVAESSRDIDLGEKLRLYAASGICEYWVVDLTANVVVMHRDANASGYSTVSSHDRTSVIAPVALPDVRLDVGSILPA